MPYCSRCGVEVHDEAENCPLCKSVIQKFYEDPAPGRTFPEDELASPGPPKMNRKERLRLASAMTGFAMLIPILISLAVDLTINRSLSWSYYPVVILTACLFLVLTALYSTRSPRRLIWVSFLIICAMLQGLILLRHLPKATIELGAPIAFYAAFCSQIVVIISKKAARKGSNIAAFILIAIGLFCIMTDLTIMQGIYGILRTSWSLIVLAATQPVALILLYLHYRKKKESRFKKYFHI